MPNSEEKYVLMFDCDTKSVGCVIIQAAFGCNAQLVYEFGFDTKSWATSPTPGMKRIIGTAAEWEMAAKMANEAHNAQYLQHIHEG